MIHHLSFPEGSSVNDFIPKEISSVQYATTRMRLISYGIHRSLFTWLRRMWNQHSVLLRSLQRTGLCWVFSGKGNFFMDALLPMGCSSSCAIFECFSTAL